MASKNVYRHSSGASHRRLVVGRALQNSPKTQASEAPVSTSCLRPTPWRFCPCCLAGASRHRPPTPASTKTSSRCLTDSPARVTSSARRSSGAPIPNGPPPVLHPDTFKSLQLIATNEMAEVSLYETCWQKLKAGGVGFGPENFVNPDHLAFVLAAFEVFYHQEEVHAFIGQGGLQANGQPTVQPSRYKLNTNTYQDCLTTANILGDNVLGVSQGVINQAIAAGDSGLAAQLDSLIAQEGQQSGFLRSEMVVNGQHSRLPAAMPAYTASTRDWLFSLLEQSFIQPGTDQNKINIPVKFPMAVTNTAIQPVDQTLHFAVNLKPQTGNNYSFANVDWDPKHLYVTYISGQNVPVSKPIQAVTMANGVLSFSAAFPAYTNIMDGFVLAALTTTNNFTTFQAASDNSVAGPATIELTN
nr:hypothetical protein CFP56_12964 [Quercus suber]